MLGHLLLASTACSWAASPACVSDPQNGTFWDHTKCSSGPGTNACCATVWSPTTAVECCQNCQNSAFGFECVAWEWYAAGAACYVCSKEVLPHRGNKTGHTTGCLAGLCSNEVPDRTSILANVDMLLLLQPPVQDQPVKVKTSPLFKAKFSLNYYSQ